MWIVWLYEQTYHIYLINQIKLHYLKIYNVLFMYNIAAFCTKYASIIAGVYVNKLSQNIAG